MFNPTSKENHAPRSTYHVLSAEKLHASGCVTHGIVRCSSRCLEAYYQSLFFTLRNKLETNRYTHGWATVKPAAHKRFDSAST